MPLRAARRTMISVISVISVISAAAMALIPVLTVLPSSAETPTAPREPADLAGTGWILGSGTNHLVDRNAAGLSTLSVAGVSIRADGGGVAAPTPDLLRLRRAADRNDLAAELLVSNYSNRLGDFDPLAAHRLLSEPGHRAAVADRLAGFVSDGGWSGVNVDLERVRASDARGLTAFVRALQEAMPAAHTVTIDVSATTSLAGYRKRGYRMAELGRAADVIRLMTYDYSGPTWSGPGPIGPLSWQRASLEAALRVVPEQRIDLGVAGYGYTWPRRGTGHTVTVAQARRLIARDGATAHWHTDSGEWSATLADGTEMWWSDRRSYARRVALARSYGVHGLAVWRLGSADTLG